MNIARLAASLGVAILAGCGGGAGDTPAAATPTASPSPFASPASPPPEPTPQETALPTVSPAPPAPASWSPISVPGGPTAREDHTWTVEPDGVTAYLFGGRSGQKAYADLWAYDLAEDTWRSITPSGTAPSARFGHETVWVDGKGLVVFAGQADATTFFNDLWAYDPRVNRWSKLPADGSPPTPRYGSCAAVGPDGRLWISHGFTQEGSRFADTRAYDFASGIWTDETPSGRKPVERCLHGCWFTDDGSFVLYAGQTTGLEALDDLWTLSATASGARTWGRVSGDSIDLPPDRNLYAFAQRGDAVYVFGGRGVGKVDRNDTYVFEVAAGGVRALEVTGDLPPGRAGATLIDDPARGRMLLFGGKRGTAAAGDLWELAIP